MSIIEAVKRKEAEAQNMRQVANEEATKKIEAARVEAMKKTKQLHDEFDETKKRLEAAMQQKIANDEKLLQEESIASNQKLEIEAKKQFPRAIKIILDKVNKL